MMPIIGNSAAAGRPVRSASHRTTTTTVTAARTNTNTASICTRLFSRNRRAPCIATREAHVSDAVRVQITTLGPLAVDGRLIRGERLITLVRTLIDARGRAVSTTSLVEAIWYGEPPADSAGAIQALVSRVRRLGLPVLAVPSGYRVPVEDVSVDAVDVRALIDRGRAALRDGDPVTAHRLGD